MVKGFKDTVLSVKVQGFLKEVKERYTGKTKWRYIIATLILVCSIGYLLIYSYGEISSYTLNKSLEERHNSVSDNIAAVSVGGKSEDKSESLSKYELSVDSLMPAETEEEESLAEEGIEEREPLDVLPSMRAFFKENKDTVGWIKVGGTKINNVVVQTTDNDFYLHSDFTKKESQPGTIFADYRCNVCDYSDLQSCTIILYGHKQANGTMFGTLHKYNNNLDFYKENPTFEFSNLFEKYNYKIISMFVVATDEKQEANGELFDYQNYINFDETGKYTFYNFINNIKSRSQVNIPVDIRLDDKFLIMSTCSYEFNDARFVVVGRRVREGEDLYVNVDKATVNKRK